MALCIGCIVVVYPMHLSQLFAGFMLLLDVWILWVY